MLLLPKPCLSFILCPPGQLSKPRTWKWFLALLSLPHPQIQSANLSHFVSQCVLELTSSSAPWHWLLKFKASSLWLSPPLSQLPVYDIRHLVPQGNFPTCYLNMDFSQSLRWILPYCLQCREHDIHRPIESGIITPHSAEHLKPHLEPSLPHSQSILHQDGATFVPTKLLSFPYHLYSTSLGRHPWPILLISAPVLQYLFLLCTTPTLHTSHGLVIINDCVTVDHTAQWA